MENITSFRPQEIKESEIPVILPAEILNIVNVLDDEDSKKDLLKYAKFCFTKIDNSVTSQIQRDRDALYDKLHSLHNADIEKVMTEIELLAMDHDETPETQEKVA